MIGNMIERNRSDCKHVEFFTHRHDGSTGLPSRRTVFTRTNTKRWELLKTASKNMKTNMLQGFEATMHLTKSKGDLSYVKNV
jgi:hypothetical protein